MYFCKTIFIIFIMKPIKIIGTLIVGIFCIFPQYLHSSTQNGDTSQGSTIYLKHKGNTSGSGRPHKPSNQQLSCFCIDGLLTVNFKYPEGLCEITLTDVESGMESLYTMDSEELTATFFVGEIGEFTIEISTESGNTYSGTLIP